MLESDLLVVVGDMAAEVIEKDVQEDKIIREKESDLARGKSKSQTGFYLKQKLHETKGCQTDGMVDFLLLDQWHQLAC